MHISLKTKVQRKGGPKRGGLLGSCTFVTDDDRSVVCGMMILTKIIIPKTKLLPSSNASDFDEDGVETRAKVLFAKLSKPADA